MFLLTAIRYLRLIFINSRHIILLQNEIHTILYIPKYSPDSGIMTIIHHNNIGEARFRVTCLAMPKLPPLGPPYKFIFERFKLLTKIQFCYYLFNYITFFMVNYG